MTDSLFMRLSHHRLKGFLTEAFNELVYFQGVWMPTFLLEDDLPGDISKGSPIALRQSLGEAHDRYTNCPVTGLMVYELTSHLYP